MKLLMQVVAIPEGKDKPEYFEAVTDDPDYTGTGQISLITRRDLCAAIERLIGNATIVQEPAILSFDGVAAHHLTNRTVPGDAWLERHGLLPK